MNGTTVIGTVRYVYTYMFVVFYNNIYILFYVEVNVTIVLRRHHTRIR